MKKNLLIMALALLASQASFAMDNNNNNKRSASENDGNPNAKKYQCYQEDEDPNNINIRLFVALTTNNGPQSSNPDPNTSTHDSLPTGPRIAAVTAHATNNNISRFCDYLGCNYQITSPFDLMNHEAMHAGDEPFPCDFNGCTFQTKYKSCLTGHSWQHINDKSHTCNHADCIYTGAPSANIVCFRDKRFACDQCNYRTPHKHVLKNHINKKHPNTAQHKNNHNTDQDDNDLE